MPKKSLGLLFIMLFTVVFAKAQCDDIEVPNAVVFDAEFCHGMEIPVLEAVVPNSNFQVYWYDAAQDGNLLFEGLGFTPNEPGTFYAEVMMIDSQCLSETRSIAELLEFPALSYSIMDQGCEDNEYYVVFTVAGGSNTPINIASNEYLVEELEVDLFKISGIPSGETPIISINDFKCDSGPILMLPMNCNCEPGSVPNVEMTYDSEVCFGESPMPLSASSPFEEYSIQWYDAPIDGDLIHVGNEFQPHSFGIYYVELVSPTGCVSSNRRIVQAHENLEISLIEMEKVCISETAFEVKLKVEGGIGFNFAIESNVGTIEQINDQEFWIRNIDGNTSLEITALDNLFCASDMISISGPEECFYTDNVIEEPIEEDNIKEELPVLAPTAFTPNGDGLNDYWQIKNTNVKEVEVIVYNRWKQVVFHSTNINEQWDGTFKGELVEVGVYPMILNVIFDNDRQRLIQSSITIIY